MSSSPDSEALAATLEPLLDLLADKLADKISERLSAQLRATEPAASTRRLLSLDELIAQLPAGKKPETWRRWLYQRTRLGLVPGCHRIGGRLFFDRDVTLDWLTNPSTPASLAERPEESLHVPAMRGDGR